MTKIQPFGCDVRKASDEERREFLRLLNEYEKSDIHWSGKLNFYGIEQDGGINSYDSIEFSEQLFTRIIPISEGIAILKQALGEEEPKETDLKVVKDRIIEAVHKSLIFDNQDNPRAKIKGINMDQLEQRIDGILQSINPPKP